MHVFCDEYAMKNNLQNKMQITYFFVVSENIDLEYVRHVIKSSYIFIRARDNDLL